MSGSKKRKVSILADTTDADYGLLKSMIRDEVSLQVKRQVRDVIQPLYKLILSDDNYALKVTELPQWLQDLAEDGDKAGEVASLLESNTDKDPWR